MYDYIPSSKPFRPDRLLRSAAWLRTVPPDRFDMMQWASFTHEAKSARTESLTECCTVGCALSWIASDPEAIEQGMELFREKGDYACVIRYKDSTFSRAAADYFGISDALSCDIFSRLNFLDEQRRHSHGAIARDAVAEWLELLSHLGEERFHEFVDGEGCP